MYNQDSLCHHLVTDSIGDHDKEKIRLFGDGFRSVAYQSGCCELFYGPGRRTVDTVCSHTPVDGLTRWQIFKHAIECILGCAVDEQGTEVGSCRNLDGIAGDDSRGSLPAKVWLQRTEIVRDYGKGLR